MRFFRKINTLIAVIFLIMPTLAMPEAIICLTGRIAINLPSYGQSFINAANLAVEQSDLKGSVVIKDFFYDDRPLSPISAYQEMISSSCSAIIGFEYLSDLLLIAKTQFNEDIPIFTSYASTLGKSDLPKNIFVFMPSYRFLASKMMDFLVKKFNTLENVLVIAEINRDSMKQYRQAYLEQLDLRHIKYATFEILENDQSSISKLDKFLKNQKHFDFIFLLSGAVAASKIINDLSDQKITFIGTENYGSSSAESVYVKLKNKNISSYFIRNFDSLKRSRLLAQFETEYKQQYHEKPLSLSAYTYDAARMILNSIKSSGSVSLAGVLSNNYRGVSGAIVENKKFQRSPEYVILKVSPDGYHYVEGSVN